MTLSNRQPALDKLNDQLRELGRESVKSTLAKPQMALAVIRAAREALINQDDAKSVYAEYIAGREYAITRNAIAAGTEDNAKSVASNTSKVKAQIAAAIAAPDFELDAIIRKKATVEKDELTKMRDEYKRLYKLAYGTEETPGIDAMMPVFESMRDVLDAQGVPLPAMTAEEKKAEKAVAFLTSTGRISQGRIAA